MHATLHIRTVTFFFDLLVYTIVRGRCLLCVRSKMPVHTHTNLILKNPINWYPLPINQSTHNSTTRKYEIFKVTHYIKTKI